MSVDYLLHESAVGYAIFKVDIQADTIGSRLKEVQEKTQDLATFGKMVTIVSAANFQTAQQALENAKDIADGKMSSYLASLIEANLAKPTGSKRLTLGVSDKNLVSSIKVVFPYLSCETPETSVVAGDLLRGLRQHADKLLKGVQGGMMQQAQLALGHSYSRSKVQFNVQRNDNHVIQAIATLDHLDKAVNTFAMRVREWYSWHFPELIKLVSDNITYAKLVLVIGDKGTLNDDKLHDLAAVVGDDEETAKNIIAVARSSMGRTLSDSDIENVTTFAERTVHLANCRKLVQEYLSGKMKDVAPNLSTLIGDHVAARLISKAGSLSNLCKYPASTVQILGAEKALFRALKTKGKTPKYGLIYHSSFISKAGMKNKGRISRFLANKCSLASRIDHFMPNTTKYGESLKRQVEERIAFYNEGVVPTKNEVVMKETMDSILADLDIEDNDAMDIDEEVKDEEKVKKEKKDKKDKTAKTKKENAEEDAMRLRKEEKKLRKEKRKEKKRAKEQRV